MNRAATKPRRGLISKREERPARQPTAETKRGGGDSGSMKRGKSKGFANSIGELMAATVAVATGGGNKKAIEVSNERSES
jgi:hypothetical protein